MQNGKVVPGILLTLVLASGAGWWYWNHTKATPGAAAENSRGGDQQRGPGGPGGGKRRGGFGPEGNRPVPVLAAPVTKGDIRVVQTAVGTVVPSAVVTVSSRVSGQLVRVLFKEGQLVRAGELLAEIDPRPFQAALTQIQGQALRNQALLRNSQIDLDRYKTLQSQDSIAAQQVDAQASLVQQYQGTIQSDQGQVDNARLQLSFTRITSPISGRIGLRQVDVGNNITTTNALAVVNTVDPIHVVFTLPEDRVSDLVKRFQEAHKSGKGLPVEAWDRGNVTLLAKGSLLSLDNQIDTTSGTVKLKAQFTNADSALFPNQFVNVRLLSDTLRDATVVANAAIQHGSAGAFVYRVIPDDKDPKLTKVTVQPVRLGPVDGDNVAVLDGLSPGDQVVISGIDKLRENAKVVISSPDGKGDFGGRRGKHGGARRGNADAGATDGEKPDRGPRPDRAGRGQDGAQKSEQNQSDATSGDASGKRRWAGRPDAGGGDRPEGGWKKRNAAESGAQASAEPADGAAKTPDSDRTRPEGGWRRRNADASGNPAGRPATDSQQ